MRLLAFGFLLLGRHRGTRALKVPCVMAVSAPKGCVLVIQGLSPMEVSNFEINLIRETFAHVYFCTDSSEGVYALFPSKGVCG